MMEQGERPARRRRRWPFFLLLFLVAISLFLHAAKALRARDCVQAHKKYKRLPVEKPIKETMAMRVRFYKAQFCLAYPQSVSYAAADLIRRFDGIIPPLRLLRVQVDPGLQDLGFALTVGVDAASLYAAQRKFAVFFSKLEMLAGIIEASFSLGERSGRLHVFLVTGRAELP